MAKVQGRILAAESGEPIGFAEVALIPVDTLMKRLGTLTNSDGTFLIEAPPGRYTVQMRALSYARKRIEGVVLEAGKVTPVSTALQPQAIQQEEVVVEATLRRSTDAGLLTARRKAATVGDAVSAEQVRRTPDKDAAEVLRRVTGLSVSDGKYVFVRGLGERYSSTEVDGVRIASPEQNKRVVPLDLLPANLLDRIVVQKTYTADRPGEFGGGDIQVHTRDFPGSRTLRVTVGQGYAEGVTSRGHLSYASTRSDVWGFGSGGRRIPREVYELGSGRPLSDDSDPALGLPIATLAQIGRAFTNVWTPTAQHTVPNGNYSAVYGDEYRVLGHPLGLVSSWSFSRSFDHQQSSARFFGDRADTNSDFNVSRTTEYVQLGGVSALSYRLSPRHTVHVRGLFTNNADDEVRTYEGIDHIGVDPFTGGPLRLRATRLQYTQRWVSTGALEGDHEFQHLAGTRLDWTLSLSGARRQQPDRRETIYNRFGPRYVFGKASREFADLRDRGHGVTATATVPYSLGALGKAKLVLGYGYDDKDRANFCRRFDMQPGRTGSGTRTPEQIFADSNFTGGEYGAYVVENNTLSVDNYRAKQFLRAGYVSTDVPFGARFRGTFGVRVEQSTQTIESFDLFFPTIITQYGRIANTDWLPSVNLTLAATDAVNLRIGASRTLSRPDLNEMATGRALEYVNGYMVGGNPHLQRAQIDNYDVRVEAFPSLSEVLAIGAFYKYLRHPIEQVIQGGSPNILIPRNSDYGRDYGMELEARAGLDRLWGRLRGLRMNANTTFIRSRVKLQEQVTKLGSQDHPLQGQAAYLVNVALAYTSRAGHVDATILMGLSGKKLVELSEGTLGDVYEQPSGNLDATVVMSPGYNLTFKLAARNLLDPKLQWLHGGLEESAWRKGRSYSIAVSCPS